MTKILKPRQGLLHVSMGDAKNFMLTGEDTQRAYTLIEDNLKPGFHLALHLHRRHTETSNRPVYDQSVSGLECFSVAALTAVRLAGLVIGSTGRFTNGSYGHYCPFSLRKFPAD